MCYSRKQNKKVHSLQMFVLLILLSLNHIDQRHNMFARALTPPTLPATNPIELTTISGFLSTNIVEDTWTVPY